MGSGGKSQKRQETVRNGHDSVQKVLGYARDAPGPSKNGPLAPLESGKTHQELTETIKFVPEGAALVPAARGRNRKTPSFSSNRGETPWRRATFATRNRGSTDGMIGIT